MVEGAVDVYVRGEPVWHLIEDFRHFVKRWYKALRRKEFFEIRYAGRRMWVNPNAIMLVHGKP